MRVCSLLAAIMVISCAHRTTQPESAMSPDEIIETAEKIGWEQLDETCGDCIDPEWALQELKKTLPSLSKKKQHKLIDDYLVIIENHRVQLEFDAPKNKLIQVTPKMVNETISEYAKRVKALKT